MEDWDQAAFQSLIEVGAEERHDLEFKAADALAKTEGKKRELTIDVSAMANAAGGTMIFGLREDAHHRASAIDPVDPRDYPKEWLDQVIHSIEPRIPEIRIQSVPIVDTTGVVYVMEIPQSVTAHQALDNRYYRRYNFERLQMRHHEVVDVMNRARLPELELEVGYKTEHMEAARHDYMLTLKVVNRSAVTAAHYKLEMTFPHSAFKARADSAYAHRSNTWYDPVMLSRREEGDLATIIYRSRRPLYPKDADDITDEIVLRYNMDNEALGVLQQWDPDFAWTIYADNALPKAGKVRMRDLQRY